ncbi:MAG: universal stress protein [Ferruginibacter sp.]
MIDYNINRILVPVDFSPASINALDTAIGMAKLHDADILLLNVIETAGLSNIHEGGFNAEESAIALTHQAEQKLQSLRHSIIERFMVPCEVIVTTGIVSSAITKISATHHADMIVMGTHGATGFRDSLIGLNAFNVVKTAACPVLTIPSHKKWESFKKILFPLRPIVSALEKYDFIRKIIRMKDTTLHILGLTTDNEKDIVLVKNLAGQLKEKLMVDEVDTSTYFKVGKNMAGEVIKIATLMETDLIVITAAIDSLFKQFFVGPYIQHILNHAQFPVLSIKPCLAPAHEEEMVQHIREPFLQEMPYK